MGDLNWNMLNPPATVTQQFDALNLTQLITEITRHNPRSPSSSTLIDIILTNNPFSYRSGVFSDSLADHCAIACVRSGLSVKRPPVIVSKRCVKKLDMEAFLNDTAAADWEKLHLFTSIEDAWSYFKNTFSLIINKHAPLKRYRIKNRLSPWFSHDLAELVCQKNYLWRKARTSKSPADWLAFRQCRNKSTQAIRSAKISYFKEKLTSCGTDARKFWTAVKSMENKLSSPREFVSHGYSHYFVNPTLPLTSAQITFCQIFNLGFVLATDASQPRIRSLTTSLLTWKTSRSVLPAL